MLEKLKKIKKIIKDNRALSDIEKKWLEVMANTKTFNESKDTFSLIDLQQTHYGFKAGVYIVAGLNYSKLESLIEYIEDYIGCTVVINKKKRTNIASIKFIFQVPVIEYKPFKVKPWEVYIGNGVDGEPIVQSMIEAPHILLAGATRGGKSKLLDCLLTTLISCCDEFELELYLIQVAKSDFIIYEDCKQVRAFAKKLKEADIMLEHIVKKMDDRSRLIEPLHKAAKGSNYQDYNKYNKSNPLSTVYVGLDEMASLIDTKGNDNETKKLKESIIAKLEAVAQYGASLGVFLISCLQRPTADKLPPSVKAQSTLKISFRQNNTKSSEVAVDDPKAALGLEQREAVYSISGEYKYLKVPTIFDKDVYEHIKASLQPNHRTLFTDLQKLNKNNSNNTPKLKGREKIEKTEKTTPKPTPKPTPITFDKVDPATHEEKIKNISNIPNFVPYQPMKSAKEVDYITANSEKPKRGKEKI